MLEHSENIKQKHTTIDGEKQFVIGYSIRDLAVHVIFFTSTNLHFLNYTARDGQLKCKDTLHRVYLKLHCSSIFLNELSNRLS